MYLVDTYKIQRHFQTLQEAENFAFSLDLDFPDTDFISIGIGERGEYYEQIAIVSENGLGGRTLYCAKGKYDNSH